MSPINLIAINVIMLYLTAGLASANGAVNQTRQNHLMPGTPLIVIGLALMGLSMLYLNIELVAYAFTTRG